MDEQIGRYSYEAPNIFRSILSKMKGRSTKTFIWDRLSKSRTELTTDDEAILSALSEALLATDRPEASAICIAFDSVAAAIVAGHQGRPQDRNRFQYYGPSEWQDWLGKIAAQSQDR